MRKLYLLFILLFAFTQIGFGQEVLLNGDFEAWDDVNTPTSWTHVESITQEPTEIHGGTYSAKHLGGTSDLGQTISGISAGADYTLKIWYKVTAGDATSARIWSYWKNGGTNLTDNADELRGPNNSYFDNNEGAWTKYEITLTAPASADGFYFEVRTYSGATVYWDDFSFIKSTAITAPVATTEDASSITSSTVTLNGTVNDKGAETTVTFQMGTSPSVYTMGPYAASPSTITAGTGNTAVLKALSGLTESTTYYYRVVATNSEGTINGTEKSFVAEDTGVEPAQRDLLVSEVVGDGADSDNGNNNGFVEIFNASNHTITLDNVELRYYNTNPGSASQTIALSGNISSGQYLVLTQSQTGFNALYGFDADFIGSSFYFNGGDDGVDLYSTSLAAVLDNFNENGSGGSPWTWNDDNVFERSDTTGTDGTLVASWTEIAIGNGTPRGSNSNPPLPVELTSLIATAINKGVMLNWSTATEVNNYGFDVEKKSIGNWVKIGFVDGHGNSNSPNDYSFIDSSPSIGEISYRLKQIDTDGAFEYSEIVTATSTNLAKYELHQNHPNPFNPSTVISFSLPEVSLVKITVYNAIGQKVIELTNKQMDAGTHTVNFDGSNLSTGFYFYRLETQNYSKTMKMILLR